MYYLESKKFIITNYWLDILSNNTTEFIYDVNTFPWSTRLNRDILFDKIQYRIKTEQYHIQIIPKSLSIKCYLFQYLYIFLCKT